MFHYPLTKLQDDSSSHCANDMLTGDKNYSSYQNQSQPARRMVLKHQDAEGLCSTSYHSLRGGSMQCVCVC